MRKILESVPNFSEGRDQEKIEQIVGPFRATEGVKLLDYSADQDHNRLVVTLVGDPSGLKSSLLQTMGIAVDLIDMRKHKGEHPRMGAIDVVPFTPIKNVEMKEAVELSHELAAEAAKRYELPIYMYENSATEPKRKNLETIRKGEYEGFAEKITNEEWKPDYGPAKLHPTAGATVIGARKSLIAFNVNLGTKDIEVANFIARKVRHSSGGLRYCKAIGVDLKEKGLVQVSMNMTDFSKTSLYQAYEMIKFEAKRFGVDIVESELIGLLPAAALFNVAEYYLQIEDFSPHQVIETRLLEDL